MAHAKVVNGYLIPDAEDVRAVVKKLREDIQSDSALAAQFDADPRAVLGERGISRDIQTEYLDELLALIPDCIATCIVTTVK